MMIRSSSFLLFIAGVAAAAGTALIVGIPVLHEPQSRALKLVLFSLPWFLMSWVLANAGASLEEARRRIDMRQSALLSPAEMLEVERSELAPLENRLRRAGVWSAVLFSIATGSLVFL